MDPELIAQLMAALRTQPQYNSKGEVKPYSLDEQAKQTNFQQDQLQSLQNPLMTALLTGGGLNGSFDPSVFAPVEDGADQYDVPNDPLEPYMSLADGSEEKGIADLIRQGMSPEQVVAKFRDEKGYKNDVNDKALDRVRSAANQLFKDSASYRSQISTLPGFDPESGQFTPPEGAKIVGGKLVIPKYKPSEASLAFQKAGLPTPDKLFGAQDFGYDPEGSQSKLADLAEKLKSAQSRTSLTRNMFNDTRDVEKQKLAALLERQRGAYYQNRGNEMVAAAAAQSDPRFGVAPTQQGAGEAPTPLVSHLGDFSTEELDAARAHRGKSQLYDMSTLVGQTNDMYGKARTKERGLERELARAKRQSDMSRNVATEEARLFEQHGLTPLTVALLQRSQALRQIGGRLG